MCGIAGLRYASGGSAPEAARATVAAMARSLAHRGPDAQGVWEDPAANVVLGHRRLSILELSPQGAQPMRSECGRFVISYNGEVYNFEALRAELVALGCVFRGRSDTEVIVQACARWGVRQAVQRFIGMFAFALWDLRTRELWLARDRLGIKPLYWGWVRGDFVFASELKAFAEHPGWRPEIDPGALSDYLRLLYVPEPRAIYRDVHKLAPGTILCLGEDRTVRQERYWDFDAVVTQATGHERKIGDSDALDELDALLRDSVRLRMVADVPLGALLSGGVDSSLVAALMQEQSGRPVRTFTIGFDEAGYDEAPAARAIAQHLNTDHMELYVSAGDALNVIPALADMYDEPFADSSQIPTFLVSALARQHVTVALSGDGGDEVFIGYRRYFETSRRWERFRRIPALGRAPMRQAARVGAAAASGDSRRRMAALADMVSAEDPLSFYLRAVTAWPAGSQPCKVEPRSREGERFEAANRLSDPIQLMQYVDTKSYLPGDILTKVDRASMAVGLEARVPLLDHRVVEFAWSLPTRMKYRDGRSKWILRQLLERYVPGRLVDRPKQGFGLPVGPWLRGPLRPWAEELLAPAALAASGLLRSDPIRQRWLEHRDGRVDWSASLWGVLMFQAWYARWMSGRPSATTSRAPELRGQPGLTALSG